jgi:hypothetical protein
MGKNTKPMLTVLVEGEKLQQFRDYALSKEVSMGWVVNRLLDRVLSGELDVMGDTLSIGVNREYIENFPTALTRENIEEIVKSSIDSQSTDAYKAYIEKSIKSYIDNLDIVSIGAIDIDELVRVSIETALEPIKISASKLDADVQSQLAAVRDELKAIRDLVVTTESNAKLTTEAVTLPTTTTTSENSADKDSGVKTWSGFFKMLGIEALTVSEAQKKENIDIRTQQIEHGLLVAREQGLGEWAVKRVGRDFVRVGN